MSVVVLPSGSLVFRLPQWCVHIDGDRRELHLRNSNSSDERGGAIFATAPMSTVRQVVLRALAPQRAQMWIEFVTGEALDLGLVPAGELGQQLAMVVATISRCALVTDGTPFYERETGVGAPSALVDDETVPRLEWKDEWREDFIRQSSGAGDRTERGPAGRTNLQVVGEERTVLIDNYTPPHGLRAAS